MDFRGHLRLPDDAGIGIPVVLRLEDIFVIISSGGDELGAWRADDVVVERLHSNQFAIELDGEATVFVAQDALGFAYEGIVAIQGLQERLNKWRMFKRSKRKKSAEYAETSVEAPSAAQTEDVVSTPEPDVGVASSKVTSAPERIWMPPRSAPPTSAVSPTSESDSPEGAVQEERSGSSPTSVRVSYPRTPPTPPTVESFVWSAVSAGPECEPEEVTAAAKGAVQSDEDSATDPEPEIVYDTYVLPVAGAVDVFASSMPAEQVPEAVVEPAVDRSPAADIEQSPLADELTAEPSFGQQESKSPEPGQSSPDVPGVVRSNGHGAARELSERSGTWDWLLSLFGRRKRAPVHDHVYGDPKTIGGLTRQVCDICGHVSFRGEDVYEGW